METLTKPGLQAMDRLRQTVAAQARLLDQTMNEMKGLESEIQERVLRAMQETEESCERQAEGRLKVAVEEAEENTRILVTEELQDRFKKKLSAELESAKQEWFSARGVLDEEIDRLKRNCADLEIERTKLVADCEAANQLLDEMREEHNRALAETDEAAAIALERQINTAADRVRSESEARFNIERGELVAQRDKAMRQVTEKETEHQKSMLMVDRFRSEMTEERDRLRRALEQATNSSVEFESECERLREEYEHTRKLLAEQTAERQNSKKSPVNLDALQGEVARVEGLIQEISQLIEDPSTELSVVIRKNAERAELDSYLRGIRFSIPGK
jgi:chromosome segregation ATPase